MRNSKNIRRKGFTLVELLIVIVVIGILSAMMMLSSTEATTSAKAAAIVSNLRNLKTAALAYYADHPSDATPSSSADVVKYLKDGSTELEAGYDFSFTDAAWYALYEIQGTTAEKTAIQTKLQNRAKQVGLCKGGTTPSSADYDGSDQFVGMFIR